MTDRKKVLGFHVFAGVDTAEIEKVLRIAKIKSFRTGEIVFRPGEARHLLFLINEGAVKAYVLSRHGQQKILHIYHPGDVFGGLLAGTMYEDQSWAQTLNDVTVCIMDEPAFKEFIQTCPEMCMMLFRYLCIHHSADIRRLESFLHTKASHRLVLALLDLGMRLGHGEDEQFELDSSFTHEELANMIGVVRSTVSTLIGRLRSLGVLSVKNRRLIVYRKAAEQFLLEDESIKGESEC